MLLQDMGVEPKIGGRTLDTSRLYGSKTSYLLIHFLIKCIHTHPPYRRCDSESSPANLSNM